MPDKIPLFVPGDTRTPMSAEVMNQILRVLNPLTQIQGAGGIRVTVSESNIIISLGSGSVASSAPTPPTPPTPTPTTGVSWKGQWSGLNSYVKGDIVRRTLPAEYTDGTVVGTYICVQDAPAGPDTPYPNMIDNAYWQVFASFACQRFVLVNQALQRVEMNVDTANANYPGRDKTTGVFVSNGTVDTGQIKLDITDTHGKIVNIQLTDTCQDNITVQEFFVRSGPTSDPTP